MEPPSIAGFKSLPLYGPKSVDCQVRNETNRRADASEPYNSAVHTTCRLCVQIRAA